MIDRSHHHVVIMLPGAFRDLAKMNRNLVYGILMKSAADAFKDWFMKKWGIEPGIMIVLHTFGDSKNYHVHVHMIITAGGINKETGQYKEIDTNDPGFIDFYFSIATRPDYLGPPVPLLGVVGPTESDCDVASYGYRVATWSGGWISKLPKRNSADINLVWISHDASLLLAYLSAPRGFSLILFFIKVLPVVADKYVSGDRGEAPGPQARGV